MGDTTNLSQLPPTNDSNITMTTQELKMPQQMHQQMPQQMPQQQLQGTISPTVNIENELNSNINQLQNTGATQLPSRDIPRDTHDVVTDPNIKLDYLPKTNSDYIGDYDSEDAVLKKNNAVEKNNSFIDKIFNEFQITLVIVILFFIFQLPFINSAIMKFIPKLFNESGNLNTFGMLSKSILFGGAYYVINKFSDKIIKQ